MPGCNIINNGYDRISADCLTVSPFEARLDVSSLCQLDCVLCPVKQRGGRYLIGRGVMNADDFTRFIDLNPQIRIIELGNSGEVFLNPHLPDILRYAFEKGVATRIAEGANLNDASDEAIEALVKYRVTLLRVPIDGATEETYRMYRVGGELKKVLRNVERINYYKKRYGSILPRLILQFIPFAHNAHEAKKIMIMARAMGMDVNFKLNIFPGPFSLGNHEQLKELIGYSDRSSYFEKTSEIYMRDICLQLWRAPQVNWDGRLLGCSANETFSYAEYALGSAFIPEINNKHMQYARKMLMGIARPRNDIPCIDCDSFADYSKYNRWFTPDEIKTAMKRGQK